MRGIFPLSDAFRLTASMVQVLKSEITECRLQKNKAVTDAERVRMDKGVGVF